MCICRHKECLYFIKVILVGLLNCANCAFSLLAVTNKPKSHLPLCVFKIYTNVLMKMAANADDILNNSSAKSLSIYFAILNSYDKVMMLLLLITHFKMKLS